MRNFEIDLCFFNLPIPYINSVRSNLYYGIPNRYLRLPERALWLEFFNNDFAFLPTKYRNAAFLTNTFFINKSCLLKDIFFEID